MVHNDWCILVITGKFLKLSDTEPPLQFFLKDALEGVNCLLQKANDSRAEALHSQSMSANSTNRAFS